MTLSSPRKILVTSALPYANGAIHLGHALEYIQSDIWVRFQKMRGNACYFVCASDCHGTPIMLRAEKEGIAPEIWVQKMQQEQAKDLADLLVEFDNFYLTHSEENKILINQIYKKLKDAGAIITKTIEQAYDPIKNLFLPDRFIKGECPKCGAKDQYGDNCEACGAVYSSQELKNPVSILSQAVPVLKSTEHYFFALSYYEEILKNWIEKANLPPAIASKLDEWFKAGLQNWDITRDKPYFGFEIPDAPDKYFYVWLDAPIGYMASFKNFCDKNLLNFNEYWQENSETELYHFLGKDILYFHALFWPAVLNAANFRLPTSIFIHGFLTINNQKMSKSRGTFLLARDYLNYLDPEYIRYYFASKLSSDITDIDLNLDDFRVKINTDLVGKIINIASRLSGFIHEYSAGKLAEVLSEEALLQGFIKAGDSIANAYEEREYSKAVREIMHLADKANQYLDLHKPWKLIKEPNQTHEVIRVASVGLNLFKFLILYLKPVLPNLAKKAEDFLNISALTWQDKNIILTNHTIKKFQPMMTRIEAKIIGELIKPLNQAV